MDLFSITSRLKHAWNAFKNTDEGLKNHSSYSGQGYYRPDRSRLRRGNERTIISSICNRIALDSASITIKHIRLDDNGRFNMDINSGLNNCLTLEANIDQTGRNFIQDLVMSMLDEGCVAAVPIDTTFNPNINNSFDILSIRTGKIIEWYPKYIKVNVYNEETGQKENIVVPKSKTAIIENPMFAVMNEPNSTMQRLIRKLNLLDVVDEQSSSGKLDMIIQLPYVIKNEARRQQAEQRRSDIEDQLTGSKYGIAYTDGTERITQLNRPIENNLMKQVEYLTQMLFSQLGMTQSILDGTADDKTMLNYYNRTIEPILGIISDEMKRKFLTKTARSQRQTIMYFRDPFKLVPVNDVAEIADKFTRNEIMTSNEIRQVIGMKPSEDPKADELRNKNINQPESEFTDPIIEEGGEIQNE
ncbi:MAG: phage portal protein [Clostridiaceae bacterium]|nr:phage portal protein [Clostridiaceae bacterium]